MKKNWKNKIIRLLILLLPFTFTACSENHGHEEAQGTAAEEVQYTCPMHPQIVRDEPGNCPICGMTLVPIQTGNAPATAISADLNYLLQPTNQTVVATINTTKPVQKEVQKEITMNGVVTYDTERQYTIPARFGGRIEKLYVQFNYQPVRKGQKLYEIYSPELVTAQKELLYLVQNDPNNVSLIQGAKKKLRLLGATEEQINQLIRTGRESYTFSVYSPYSGYVVDPALPAVSPTTSDVPASANGMGGMGGSSMSNNSSVGAASPAANATSSSGFSIREGMYVNTGQALLKVIDASQVWATFNATGTQAGLLSKGTPVTISFNQIPNKTVQSKISLVEPVFEAGDDFAQVRAPLPAQDKLTLIGQLVTGKTTYSTDTALWVPKEAVLDLGTQSVAFLQTNGIFKPVTVRVGQRANDQIEILKGLSAQDIIAENAQFLVDSESFIRVEANNR